MTSLTLSFNRISSLHEVTNLGKSFPKLEFLTLAGNPVTRKYHITIFVRFPFPLSLSSSEVHGCTFLANEASIREICSQGIIMFRWNSMNSPQICTILSTGRQHYRLYAIHHIPTLRVLDMQRISRSERDKAQRLAQSAAGAAMESDVQLEMKQQQQRGGAKTYYWLRPTTRKLPRSSFTLFSGSIDVELRKCWY